MYKLAAMVAITWVPFYQGFVLQGHERVRQCGLIEPDQNEVCLWLITHMFPLIYCSSYSDNLPRSTEYIVIHFRLYRVINRHWEICLHSSKLSQIITQLFLIIWKRWVKGEFSPYVPTHKHETKNHHAGSAQRASLPSVQCLTMITGYKWCQTSRASRLWTLAATGIGDIESMDTEVPSNHRG